MRKLGGKLYAIVWRYGVRRGAERRFERLYGPRGVWARFFAKGRGYSGTQLYREVGSAKRTGRSKDRPLQAPASYVTVDLWRSRAAFTAFHRRHHAAYQRIDRQCESLTVQEERIGAWTLEYKG